MSAPPRILAVARVDERGVSGTGGLRARWDELGTTAPGSARAYRRLAGRDDATFRRLNRQSRAIVFAALACGLDELLTDAEREATALVAETMRGSLEADLKYTRALDAGFVHAAVFPYTLQSTCLGEVALRHGLRGPTISLSSEPGREGEGLREARRMLAAGEAPFAVACTIEALDEPLPDVAPHLGAVLCLLAPAGSDRRAVAPWPGDEDPFRVLARACP